jgi:TRAP-type mannitol/chloroaromatic compound transport system permease small subunit
VINAIEKLSDLSGRAVSVLILPVVLVTVYMVVMRYFFHASAGWGFEVTIFLYGIYFMISGAHCLKVRGHVGVDIIAKLLPTKAQKFLEIFASLVIAAFCFFLIWQGTKMAWQSTMNMEHSIHQTAFNPQIWWFKWVIPLSGLLILLQTIADILKTILSMKEKEVTDGC